MSTQPLTPLEAVLRRDRMVVWAGLAGVVVLAWAYTLYLAWDMSRMDMASGGMAMPMAQSWTAVDFLLMFVMWAVMMVAMMVPSAAPMVLTFATINRRRGGQGKPFVPTGVFVWGYVVVWSGFALLATTAQWGLNAASLLSPMMASASPFLGAGLLIAAGAFQWSPIKYTCLNHCRTPLGFLMSKWRSGTLGALVMGLSHGRYCLGCCWVLMSLLFVLGVMNLLWIAALAAFVLVEKVLPRGVLVARVSGLLMILWGAILLATSLD